MKILIDVNHPAHVHFIKNLYFELIKQGNEVIVTASKKEISFELLYKFNIPFIDVGTYGNSIIKKLSMIPIMAFRMYKIIKRENPDILLGLGSSRLAQAGFLTKKICYIFGDTEHVKEQIALFKPFATKIFTPDCFLDDLGPKQVRYSGYHELAYLHPNSFTPNPEVLKEIGLTEFDRYFIVRFVSWEASHDIGQKGLSLEEKRKLIETLKSHGKIIISSEKELPTEFEEYRMKICPTKMHDLLYYATLFIGESGTMATESSLLGTPSILINILAKTAGNHKDLNSYNLQYYYDNFNEAFEKINEIINSKNIKNIWRARLMNCLDNKIDVNDFILSYIKIEKNDKN